MGYRFELDGKTLAYCTDTGICDNAMLLAEDADLLITECSHKPGEQSPDWPHLNPRDAAEIARRAKAKRLALTHFDASRYTTIQERLDAAKTITNFNDVVVGHDDSMLEL